MSALLGLILGATGGFVVFADLRALGVPSGQALGAGGVSWLVLPLVWHVFAERKRTTDLKLPWRARTRLVLRSVGVNALVLLVAFASLGPQGVWANARAAFPPTFGPATPPGTAPDAPVAPPPAPVADAPEAHELETFVPSDATWVVGIAGSAALQQLVSPTAGDTEEKLAAMHKCHIQLERAQVLIAGRGASRLAVARAPGLSDEGNLYCLVGALGSEHFQLKFEPQGSVSRFTVTGLVPSETLTFTNVGQDTVFMVADDWSEAVEQRRSKQSARVDQGPLGQPLARVDRHAALWAVSVTRTPQGPWDLSAQARFEGPRFNLQATSVPPAGPGEMAEARLTVPLAFARALPDGALTSGAVGLVQAVAATGAALPVPPQAAPAQNSVRPSPE